MEAQVVLPSNRRFGLTFCAVFFALGIFALIKSHRIPVYLPLFFASFVLGALALKAPRTLGPLNKLWFLFGQLLARVVSPLVLGVIYFGLIVPTALVARLLGRDELRLARPACASYWIDRDPPSPTSQSFTQQF